MICKGVTTTSLTPSKDCKERWRVIDSAFEKEIVRAIRDARGTQVGGQWTERWTARACGVNKAVRFKLTADGKGGTNWTMERL